MRRAWITALSSLALAGCGSATTAKLVHQSQHKVQNNAGPVLHGHPQAVEPVAGAVAPTAADPNSVSVSSAGTSGSLAQPASNEEIRKELAASGLGASNDTATLTPSGLAIPPDNSPAAVQEVIDAGNEIAHLPYRFGGGHGTFIDTAYDCSGSLSFVFAAAGLLHTTMTSGEFMHWGDAGPGKWITVYANDGHTFMYVAGLRFDTVALAETGSRWSNRQANEGGNFVARHPPGL